MKKKIYFTLIFCIGILVSGCNGGNATAQESTTEITTENTTSAEQQQSSKIDELGERFDALQAQALQLNNEGSLSDEDYETLISYGDSINALTETAHADSSDEIARIGAGLDSIDSKIKDINKNANAELVNKLENLTENAKELKSIVAEKVAGGSVDKSKAEEVNSCIETLQASLDKVNGGATAEEIENIKNDVGAVQGSLVAIAGEVSTDNTLINKILGIE